MITIKTYGTDKLVSINNRTIKIFSSEIYENIKFCEYFKNGQSFYNKDGVLIGFKIVLKNGTTINNKGEFITENCSFIGNLIDNSNLSKFSENEVKHAKKVLKNPLKYLTNKI